MNLRLMAGRSDKLGNERMWRRANDKCFRVFLDSSLIWSAPRNRVFAILGKKKKRRGKKTALIDSFTDYIPINDEVISTTEGGGTSTDGCDQ